jgi:hypothetical protein
MLVLMLMSAKQIFAAFDPQVRWGKAGRKRLACCQHAASSLKASLDNSNRVVTFPCCACAL